MVILSFLGVLAAAYVAACWLVLSILITPERKISPETPASLGFPAAQAVSFESAEDGVPLRGWLVPGTGSRVIVLVHGIHSNAWDCQTPDLVAAYGQAGFAVFLFDLRAHGISSGEHAGLGLLERRDVKGAVKLLRAHGFEAGYIGIHGTSYGAATALLAAEQIPEIGAVIADSAFATISEVISKEFQTQTGLPASRARLFLPGMSWIAATQYAVDLNAAAPERVIANISPRPILLIHGIQDPVIPFEHARRLQRAADPSTELWALPGGHTEGVRTGPNCRPPAPTRDAFLAKVTRFFDKSL